MRLLGPALLLVAGLALGAIALLAHEPTHAAPSHQAVPDKVPFELAGDVPSGHVVRRLDVEGICCSGCGGKLYAALTALDEVVEAAVDPVLGQAAAVVPASFDVARLERALTFEKYAAKRHE